MMCFLLVEPLVMRIMSSSGVGPLGHRFFIFCFTNFFRSKLGSDDEIKIKLKFNRTIFQLN